MNSRFPFPPYPAGWYAIGRDADYSAGRVHKLARFGRELVAYRAGDTVAVLDAFCPHLGAHLGMGRIEDDRLICAFHEFGFAPDGRCVSVPPGYGDKVPKIAARRWPTTVVDGFLLMWFDPVGGAPAWTPASYHGEGWRPILSHTWRLRTHPQETGEGSVDVGHLRSVHRYERIDLVHPLETDGPFLRTHYRVTRRVLRGMRGDFFQFDIISNLHGLGFSVVEAVLKSFEMRYRIWILATPVDGETVDYCVGLSLENPPRPGRLHPVLGLLPRSLATLLIERIAYRGFLHDVALDFPIWESKGYVDPPGLAAEDGPIGRYRRWAAQFYV